MIYIIKVLILYYLSIKSTHGYEIQKFIQVNHMDNWTKIQSGSIYYALSKLEKEGFIEMKEKVGSKAKARKIYSITESGKAELKKLVKKELNQQISDVGSDKFIIYPLLNVINKDEMITEIKRHIEKLNTQKKYFKKWQSIKINEHTLPVEKFTFEMILSNLEYQIKWHNTLIDNIEDCINASKKVTKLISEFDFSEANNVEDDKAKDIESLKNQILKNPNNAHEKLEQLIELLKR